jgi:dolichyl-phosphate-mannose-protein mannosyltransferase/tetratricopeptide repeat protein
MSAALTNDEGRKTKGGNVSSFVVGLLSSVQTEIWLGVLILLALGLRLLAWRWHELYDLGGDEREYFNQALTLLREHVYAELNLMRPPLYTGFLAACMYLFDSLVQRLRLVQAVISALTVVPIYLLTQHLFGRRVGFIAALLSAISYTLAAHATELLTETLFVFGLAMLFWLLVATSTVGGRHVETQNIASLRAGRWSVVWPILAGLNVGALALLRSVALPLLPLGALWLLLRRPTNDPSTPLRAGERRPLEHATHWWSVVSGRWSAPLCFVLSATLLIAPWTARNYATYGAFILIDTTGAENLWLDNNPAGGAPDDPLGREAAKKQLYALGDDRAARQRLATSNGTAAIRTHPAWFLQKAWGEAKQFFALEYFDDMRERRAIWMPPLEVWLRLALGDGLWLLLLFGGVIGFWLAPPRIYDLRLTIDDDSGSNRKSKIVNPKWLFVPWVVYILLTSMLFHVELRYRLPIYPALLPYAAWMIANCRLQIADWARARFPIYNLQSAIVGATLTCLAIAGVTLLHRPYISESWMLTRKHIQLWQAQRALDGGDASSARVAADAALALDPESALAQVALARAALAQGDQTGALAALDQAIAALPAHPHAHLLRGAILRDQGDLAAARAEFSYEQASLEDLQGWSWQAFAPFAVIPPGVDVGGALDLGYLRGFWPAVTGGSRWSKDEAEIVLGVPQDRSARLELQLNGDRPTGAPPLRVSIRVGGRELGQLVAEPGWHSYSFGIPADLISETRRLIITIRSDTFRPRNFDRASPDNRLLGVLVGRVEIKMQ